MYGCREVKALVLDIDAVLKVFCRRQSMLGGLFVDIHCLQLMKEYCRGLWRNITRGVRGVS